MKKPEVYDFLARLRDHLYGSLSPRRDEIVSDVSARTPQGGESEGQFIKLFLAHSLGQFFRDDPDKLVIEGINSKGKTQFKNPFFGNKPGPDFVFNHPHLFTLVGEVKYQRLRLREFATGIGQLIAYIESSGSEETAYRYGYLLFFNTEGNISLSTSEQEFHQTLWDRDNVFIQII